MRSTVLVTGANSGIGLATVPYLADVGFRCAGTVRNQADSEVLADTATDAGDVTPVMLDVTGPAFCAQVVAGHHRTG